MGGIQSLNHALELGEVGFETLVGMMMARVEGFREEFVGLQAQQIGAVEVHDLCRVDGLEKGRIGGDVRSFVRPHGAYRRTKL